MSRSTPVLQLLFAAFLFGASNVVQKLVFEDLDAWSSLGMRGLLACLALAPVAVFEMRRSGFGFARVFIESLPVSLFFFGGMTAQLLGATQTSATNVGFLINTCVVFTPFLMWLISGQRPTRAVLSAAAMCFAGVALLSGSMPAAFGWGDTLCVLSALCYAAWIISLGRVMGRVQAPVTVTMLQWVLPAVAGLAISGGSLSVSAVSAQLPNLLFLGVVVSAFGFMLAAKAQEKLAPCAAAMCYSTEAVFGALVAYAAFNETLSVAGAVGAAMTLVSIVLVQCMPVREARSMVSMRIEPRFA